MQTVTFPAPPRSDSSRSNERITQRMPVPSPLQVSHVSSPITDRFIQMSPREVDSPASSKGGEENFYSPKLLHESPASGRPPSDSPQERGRASAYKGQVLQGSKDSVAVLDLTRISPLATPKANIQRQIRNISAPVAATDLEKQSPPYIPSDTLNAKAKSSISRAEARLVPRNSSLDSTMSSVSSNASMSQSFAAESTSPRSEEIAQAISTAGSAGAAIALLLKEKKHAAAQNAQLFRLVQKQRNLMATMKADLDHALQEKDVYRRRLKEKGSKTASPAPAPNAPLHVLRQQSRAESASSTRSQDDLLPIQRHSIAEEKTTAKTDVDVLSRDLGTVQETMKQQAISISTHRLQSNIVAAELQVSYPGSDTVGGTRPSDKASQGAIISPEKPIPPLDIHKRTFPELIIQTAVKEASETVPSPSSFAARRSLTGARKVPGSSPLLGAGFPTEDTGAGSPVTRKGPPAPLNLLAQNALKQDLPRPVMKYGSNDHTYSDYDVAEVDELPAFERGRKKTREEDDREREYLMKKEQESRSLSKKKNKKSASKPSPHELQNTQSPASSLALPKSPAIKAFAPTSQNDSQSDHVSTHASLAGVLSGPPSSIGSTVERSVTVSPPPMSPGLPTSPRPTDRLAKIPTLPRSPRDGFASPLASPNSLSPPHLSPRPPRHPIPLPAHQTSLGPPSNVQSPEAGAGIWSRSSALLPADLSSLSRSQPTSVQQQPERSPALQTAAMQQLISPESAVEETTMNTTILGRKLSLSEISVGGIYKGLASELYPNLLLTPNAIPSVIIKVTSSRLKPSRNSTLSPKGIEDEPVFTLGVFARSDQKQLWRIEKPIMSLPALAERLGRACLFDVKLPDQSLFSGHSPAKIDARREALERYFESILDTHMNEKAALEICQYLSTQVISAEDQEGMKTVGASDDQSPATVGPDGKVVKEGYLTKRGKQFGGWKARFFVLDEAILRYYDAPGGTLQGTIKLTSAQIGRQQTHANQSPTRGEDPDNEFRHAFLILEPKKKDSKSHMKHVLCAESDHERDEWVYALLQYVGVPALDRKSNRSVSRSGSGSKSSARQYSAKDVKESEPAETSARASFDTLQGTSYDEMAYAPPPYVPPPTRAAPIPPTQMASPARNNFQSSISSSQPGHANISRPSNGTVIQDASAWGNKTPGSPKSKEREQKKRSIWGFRDKAADVMSNHSYSHSNGTAYTSSATVAVASSLIVPSRPVFGIPLNEAVQYCPARGSTVALPSVVYRCIEYLEAKGAANEEGIFRLSGSNVIIKQLKEKFNNESDFDFLADDNYYDVHAVASLLKLYLRELPSVVLTRELHHEFLRLMELDDKAKKIAGYNILVHRLPLPNWTLVRSLSKFLIGIVSNAHINKMTVRNVGIVFAPTLSMPAPVFSAFLTDFDAIFVADPAQDGTYLELSSLSPFFPSDMGSPRHQILSEEHTPSYQYTSFSQPLQSYNSNSRKASRGEMSGHASVQPAYETTVVGAPQSLIHGNRHSVLIPGTEPSMTPRSQGIGLESTGMMRDNKARRRESAMILTNTNGVGAQRKSSMPTIGFVDEE